MGSGRKKYNMGAAFLAVEQARATQATENAQLKANHSPRQGYSFTKEIPGRGQYTVAHITNERMKEIVIGGTGSLPDMGLGGLLHVVRNKDFYKAKLDDIAQAAHMSFRVHGHACYVSIAEIASCAMRATFSFGYGAITLNDRRELAKLFPVYQARFNPSEAGVVPDRHQPESV